MNPSIKKIQRAWSFYDWANSVFPLVITATIFPIYYNNVTSANGTNLIHVFGREYVNTALYTYALSFSFLIVCFLSPILSGIADYCDNKKSFLRFFCYLGSFSCSMLYFFTGEFVLFGLFFFMMASIGYSGSLVFYNAYLPEIAPPEHQDKLSAKGFALGYVGSALLLIFCLTLVLFPQWFGNINAGLASRLSFLLSGLWWFGFAHITLNGLPTRPGVKSNSEIILKGYMEIMNVWKEIKHSIRIKRYLISFFIYNMGVQTIMLVAALFGTKELGLESSQLITTILIIQFVAIAGAFIFSNISGRFGNFIALGIALVLWVFICIAAYYVYTPMEFYGLAFAVGMVMGGIQSLSRSTYSKMLPEGDHTSYFSFYDVCEKIGIVLGTASYGLIEELTGSMRNSIIALVGFFAIGFLLLLRVPRQKLTELKTGESANH